MKNNIIKTISYFLILTGSGVSQLHAQEANAIKKMVEAQRYVFKAQTVSSMDGGSRQLTPGYDINLIGDSIVADLPYFGRANTASLDPAKESINFTSTNFEYKVNKKKKGWDVVIKPKDVAAVRQLVFFIFDNGYTTLNVISTNRQSISFYGSIEERKEKKVL